LSSSKINNARGNEVVRDERTLGLNASVT